MLQVCRSCPNATSKVSEKADEGVTPGENGTRTSMVAHVSASFLMHLFSLMISLGSLDGFSWQFRCHRMVS